MLDALKALLAENFNDPYSSAAAWGALITPAVLAVYWVFNTPKNEPPQDDTGHLLPLEPERKPRPRGNARKQPGSGT